MWFAEMSELTDEPCAGQRGGSRLSQEPQAPHGAQASPPLQQHTLLSQKVPLSTAANPSLCVRASPASLFLHRLNAGKAVILKAIFLLGFLWLCSPKVGETRDKAFHKPRLCHHVLLAPNLTEKYWGLWLVHLKPTAKAKTDAQREQRAPWFLLVAVVKIDIQMVSKWLACSCRLLLCSFCRTTHTKHSQSGSFK